ncbi:hypothetical protein [Pseudomonas putida]|uniref:hypothetical protein n=1 Tax=Pseudomonas putida TaxID=303 RepID=UPI00300EC8E4
MKVHHFQALVLGALCLGAAVLAAETYNHHQQLAGIEAAARDAPADPAPSLRRDIDALNSKVVTLQPQIAALGDAQNQHATAQTALDQQLEELAASVRALQATPPGPSSAQLNSLEQRVGTTEATLTRLTTRPDGPAPATAPAPTTDGKTKAKAPEPPFTLQGVETRGAVRFVAALPAGAHALTTVHLLQPGDSLNGWQLRAIRDDQAVFHVPGHGDRTLPLP